MEDKTPFCLCCLSRAAAPWVPAGPEDYSQGSAERLPPCFGSPGREEGVRPSWEATHQSPGQERKVRGSWEPGRLSWLCP